MERWYQSVIMGPSSVERAGTAPGECPAISEENRDKLARLDPRSGHLAGRRTTLVEDGTCREAAYLNMAVKLSAHAVTGRACARPAPARPAAYGRRYAH